MAETDFARLSDAQKRVWSQRTWKAGRDNSFWFANGFVGSGTQDTSKPIHLVTELTRMEGGDECVMQLIHDLDGDGVPGDDILEGNEETLVNDAQTITIDQLRHGVKSKGKMSEQKTVIQFRAQARDKLAFWIGDKLDEMAFLMASGVGFDKYTDRASRPATSKLNSLAFAGDVTSPSSNRQFYAGDATSLSSLSTSDQMSWNGLVGICAFAKRKRIKPIRMNGRNYYTVVMSPEQARDLKQDPNYQEIVSRAGERGNQNPLFKGSFAVVDGLILHEHAKVTTNYGLDSGTGQWGSGNDVAGAQALLLGAQALGLARLNSPEWEESDSTDYGNKQGISVGRIVGMLKPQFEHRYDGYNNEDFAVISYYTAAEPSATASP